LFFIEINLVILVKIQDRNNYKLKYLQFEKYLKWDKRNQCHIFSKSITNS